MKLEMLITHDTIEL